MYNYKKMAYGKRKGKAKRAPKKKMFKAKGRRKVTAPAKKYNLEIKHITSSKTLGNFAANSESATNVKNSHLMVPVQCMSKIEQGLGQGKLIGEWICPKYCTLKYEIVASHIDPTYMPYMAVWETIGWLKSTGSKANIALTNEATWASALKVEVMRELRDSEVTSDFLNFDQKNRNLHIVSHRRLKFNMDGKAAADYSALSNLPDTVAPPIQRRINFNRALPNNKTRLEVLADSSGYVANDSFVPFILLTCNELDAHGSYFTVNHMSRFYYTDS